MADPQLAFGRKTPYAFVTDGVWPVVGAATQASIPVELASLPRLHLFLLRPRVPASSLYRPTRLAGAAVIALSLSSGVHASGVPTAGRDRKTWGGPATPEAAGGSAEDEPKAARGSALWRLRYRVALPQRRTAARRDGIVSTLFILDRSGTYTAASSGSPLPSQSSASLSRLVCEYHTMRLAAGRSASRWTGNQVRRWK